MLWGISQVKLLKNNRASLWGSKLPVFGSIQRLEVFPCDFCRWISYIDKIHLEAPRTSIPKILSAFTPQAFSSFSILYCMSRMVLYPVSIVEGAVGGQSVLSKQYVCWGNGAVLSKSSLIKPVHDGCWKLQRMRIQCLKATLLGYGFYCTLQCSVYCVAACATHTQRIPIPLPPGSPWKQGSPAFSLAKSLINGSGQCGPVLPHFGQAPDSLQRTARGCLSL